MELLRQLLYTAVGTATLILLCVRVSLRYWKTRGILHERPKFPWGHLKGVFRHHHLAAVLAEMYEKYNGQAPFIGFYAYLQPLVLVLDLELVRHVLERHAEHFAERGLYHNAKLEPLSLNLMQLDGERWTPLRRKMQHCFAAERQAQLMPTLLRVADTYKRALEIKQRDNELLVINELVDCWNVDVISRLAFGLEGDSLQYPQTKFRLMTRQLWAPCSQLKAYVAFSFPTLARLLRLRCYSEQATEYFGRLICEKLLERQYDRLQHNDFLQLFDEQQLSQRELVAQACSFLACGLEACNATLSFCLYELTRAPDIQQRAREELQQHQGPLTLQALQKFHYLRQILYETWRLHSPHAFLLRQTLDSFEVPNSVFMLRENNRLVIPIAAIHRDPRLYPQPLRFDPSRFTAAAQQQRHPMAFLPFGAGPRNCLAQHFVQMQLLLCLATLLQHYKFSVCDETPLRLDYNNTQLLVTPKQTIKVRVERLKIT